METKRARRLQFGGICSITVGILCVLTGVTHLLLPRGQLRGASGVDSQFFESLASNSMVFVLHYWIVVFLSILSVAVILSLFELLQDHRSGLVSWAVVIGLFAAGLSMLDFAYVGIKAPQLAKLFVSAPQEVRSALLMWGLRTIDPCFLSWGLMGIFVITINAYLLRYKFIKHILSIIGLIGGAFYFLLFLGSLFHVSLMIDISAVIGGVVLAPIWYIGIGFVLLSSD